LKNKGRYDVSGLVEAQFEPGSNNAVLKNKLGITDPDEMDRVEAKALIKATDALFHEYRPRKYVSKKVPFCGQFNDGFYRSKGLEKTTFLVKTRS
jgi:hypothetical protein